VALQGLLDLYAEGYTGIFVLENLASIVHFIAAFLATVWSCGRRFFPFYAAYQAGGSVAKELFLPSFTLADVGWDFFGDLVEYLAGAGAAYVAGLADSRRLQGRVALICSPRVMAAALAAMLVFWAAAFASGWTPPVLRGGG